LPIRHDETEGRAMRSIDRGVYAPPLRRDFAPIDPLVDEPRRGPMLLLLSVGVLLALVGVIWSTYNQGVRERDDPPVIAAQAEPYKVAPADPGGETTDYTGIQVYTVLEHAAPPVIEEEQAAFELAEPDELLPLAETIHDADVVEPHGVGSEPIVEAEPPEAFEEEPAEGVADAVAQAGAAESSFGPVPRLKPLRRTPADAAAEAAGPRTLESSNARDPSRPYFARREPVVRTNPQGIVDLETVAPETARGLVIAESAVAEAAAEAGSSDIAAATPSPADAAPEPAPPAAPVHVPGSFMVQLASLRSEDAADVAWREFRSEFRDLLGGYEQNVERADLGDRGVHYRLQVGVFGDRTAASSFCDAVKARGRDCLVVTQ
jgi:hypothetical protein